MSALFRLLVVRSVGVVLAMAVTGFVTLGPARMFSFVHSTLDAAGEHVSAEAPVKFLADEAVGEIDKASREVAAMEVQLDADEMGVRDAKSVVANARAKMAERVQDNADIERIMSARDAAEFTIGGRVFTRGALMGELNKRRADLIAIQSRIDGDEKRVSERTAKIAMNRRLIIAARDAEDRLRHLVEDRVEDNRSAETELKLVSGKAAMTNALHNLQNGAGAGPIIQEIARRTAEKRAQARAIDRELGEDPNEFLVTSEELRGAVAGN